MRYCIETMRPPPGNPRGVPNRRGSLCFFGGLGYIAEDVDAVRHLDLPTSCAIVAAIALRAPAYRPGTVRAVPDTTCEIVDNSGRPAAAGA
jgi:hypothetical protein